MLVAGAGAGLLNSETATVMQSAVPAQRAGWCLAHLRVLTTLPPTSPSCHMVLIAQMWACSLCQPGPHHAFLMPPTP
jgi:hypothetical protein